MAATPSTFTVCFSSNSSGLTYRDRNYRKPDFYELRMLQRSLGRFFEQEYAELLKTLNYLPSVNGVKTKKLQFDQLITQVRSLWTRHVRFDFRQPCWRSGRWKSLT